MAKQNISSRFRKFSCITYLNEIQLELCLTKHINQIRYYAYAYHDKDRKEDGSLKEPHIHLIIVTYNTCSLSAIRRWFSGFVDKKGMDITTTAQHCIDVYEMYDYLTHNTKQCREQGKYQYDKKIIKTNDKSNYFQASEESEYDNATIATLMLLKGAKVSDLVKMFGRDFIYHYNSIKDVANDIRRSTKYNMSFDDICEHEYQLEIARLENSTFTTKKENN